jgi:hypothetical protein
MPFGERSPSQTGITSPLGVILSAQPRQGATDLPRPPQKPTLSVTQALPCASNFGPKANSW